MPPRTNAPADDPVIDATKDDVASRVDMNNPGLSGREAVEKALAEGAPADEAKK